MYISNTDMRSLLRAISVLHPYPEQSIREWDAIRRLKLFARKQHRRHSKQASKQPSKNNRQWQN